MEKFNREIRKTGTVPRISSCFPDGEVQSGNQENRNGSGLPSCFPVFLIEKFNREIRKSGIIQTFLLAFQIEKYFPLSRFPDKKEFVYGL
jgi:hypothetical protein